MSALLCHLKQIMTKLERADSWQFNSFKLNEVSGGRPLSVLSFFLFKRFEVSIRLRKCFISFRVQSNKLDDLVCSSSTSSSLMRSSSHTF